MCQHSSKAHHAPTVCAKGFATPESRELSLARLASPGVRSIKLGEDETRMEPMAFCKT